MLRRRAAGVARRAVPSTCDRIGSPVDSKSFRRATILPNQRLVLPVSLLFIPSSLSMQQFAQPGIVTSGFNVDLPTRYWEPISPMFRLVAFYATRRSRNFTNWTSVSERKQRRCVAEVLVRSNPPSHFEGPRISCPRLLNAGPASGRRQGLSFARLLQESDRLEVRSLSFAEGHERTPFEPLQKQGLASRSLRI